MPDPDHRLEFLDYAAVRLQQATGRDQLMQSVWVYDRPVDRRGLERFHRNFSRSIGNRLVEPSPFPFARPRWVTPSDQAPPLLVGRPRPRAELLDWADGLGRLTFDPVHGPAWCLALQPFTDGSAAVSMIGSHAVGDGAGALRAVHATITDTMRDVPYDTAGRRSLIRALPTDGRQVLADLGSTARAVASARRFLAKARRARRRRPGGTQSPEPSDTTVVQIPTAAVFLSASQWDERASTISGNSYSLVAALAARLGQSLGRCRESDGTVTLQMAINRRRDRDDDRAIAMAFARSSVDPTEVVNDLAATRTVLRDSLRALDERSEPTLELLPLVPWLPQRAIRRGPDLVFAYSKEMPVSCSNLGDLSPDIARIDGTPAQQLLVRGLDSHVTKADLMRSRGHLVVVSGRIGDQISISVEAWQLGAENSRPRLRTLLDTALADFGLQGTHL